MAGLADKLGCVVAVSEPALLLPAIKTRRALADFGDLRLAQRVFAVQADTLVIDKRRAQALVRTPVGNAPRADAVFVFINGVYRAHINVASRLIAAHASGVRGLHRTATDGIGMINKVGQCHVRILVKCMPFIARPALTMS
ncbi:hypothetical protein D3C75_1049030 [compost metagenome]